MNNTELTLAEAMALAVLKGDLAAAHALCDQLLESRGNPRSLIEKVWEERQAGLRSNPATCWEVWRWPEFRAFAERLGIPYGMSVYDLEIIMHHDELVKIKLTARGDDTGPATIPSTTVHNEVLRTVAPNPAVESHNIDQESFLKP